MKLIFSRKGFDSGSGGCASAILPDGSLVSLPIPDGRSLTRYGAIDGPTGQLVEDLTNGRYQKRHPAHLDPDLEHGSIPRTEGWRGALGQTSAAASHLKSQGVTVGDVFLFFGWFRDVDLKDGKYRFASKGRNIHALFGWLQIGEVIDLSSGDRQSWQNHPWLATHPHVRRGREAGNTIYVASEQLVIGDTAFGPGWGRVSVLEPRHILTRDNAPGRSAWSLPSWMHPDQGSALSYHLDAARWGHAEAMATLNIVGRGQEFVLTCNNQAAMKDYLTHLIGER
ncbi:hypothetical protein [Rhizobium sp. MHM7A]|uniref:Nmad3 family putative nucleotide modification protein n=1 Tax=Rhizobium sp. MHM7A TaxID=2583233 RepID=UPI0014874F73|nr:hypothetical protein [Rhizobium sp. MHM7A]